MPALEATPSGGRQTQFFGPTMKGRMVFSAALLSGITVAVTAVDHQDVPERKQ